MTNISLSNVSRVIKEFEEFGLVQNSTPSFQHGCIYHLTFQALEFRPEFEEYLKFRVYTKIQEINQNQYNSNHDE